MYLLKYTERSPTHISCRVRVGVSSRTQQSRFAAIEVIYDRLHGWTCVCVVVAVCLVRGEYPRGRWSAATCQMADRSTEQAKQREDLPRCTLARVAVG